MEDVCFWLVWTCLVLDLIHEYGDGVLHWYMVTGILFGVLGYHHTISSSLMKWINNILCKVKKGTKNRKKLLKKKRYKG